VPGSGRKFGGKMVENYGNLGKCEENHGKLGNLQRNLWNY
jgi:hypothetical protein